MVFKLRVISKDIKTTLRYAHLAPQGLKSAVESLS